ncbi:hypothetical protein EDC01DRAFT_789855 [Geopyxis carbonaria]|nr:hypothetical protein EDC01DRAFT_789855 [Geopyxis carbonaria]
MPAALFCTPLHSTAPHNKPTLLPITMRPTLTTAIAMFLTATAITAASIPPAAAAATDVRVATNTEAFEYVHVPADGGATYTWAKDVPVQNRPRAVPVMQEL